MKIPSRFEAAPAYIRRGRRLLLRTKVLDAIQAPVQVFEAATNSLESRYDECVQARQASLLALRGQAEAQLGLEQEVRGVGLAILTVDRGRRRSVVYLKYFPKGYGTTLSQIPQDTLATAAGLLAAMADETIPDILARRDSLTAARSRLESAIAARQAARDALAQAKAMLEDEKLAWRSAFDQIYFAARAAYPGRRSYVESLFRVSPRRRVPEEDEGAPVEEGAAVSQTTGSTTGGGISADDVGAPASVSNTSPAPSISGSGEAGQESVDTETEPQEQESAA